MPAAGRQALRAALGAPPVPGMWALRGALARASARTPLASRALVRLDRLLGAGRRARWGEVGPALLADGPELVSVDIFDTLIVRPVVGEQALLHVVAAALADAGAVDGPAEDFASARRAAARAHPRLPLEDLYGRPPLAARVTGGAAWEVEQQVEAGLARPVPGAAAALAALRAAGVDLLFLTDMHLPRALLWQTLVEHGLAAEGDRLVISSETGAAKSDGALFARLPADRVGAVHVGNDLWSDVAMAQRHGVTGVPLGVAEPTRLERRMARRAGTTGPAIAAAARQARLAADDGRPGPVADALRETGADVAGQCLTAFLLWVRARCEAEGIADVAFLARDGELPLRMARAMPADHWDGFRLEYLEYASRRAWTVAAADALGIDAWMAVGNADERSFLNTSRHVVPFSSLLERLALSRDDLAGHPALAALDLDQPLPPDLVEVWEALLGDEAIRARIAERAAAARALLVEHLGQLGLGERRLALVDVGWRGQLAWMLSAVLRDVTGAEPVHLHFGGANVASGVHGHVDIRRFALDDSVAPLPFPHVVSCVETFTASGRARALDLERTGTGDVRVVTGRAVPGVANEARGLVWDAALATAAALPSREVLARWGCGEEPLDEEVRAVLTAFWTRPEHVHALAASRLQFEVDEAGAVVGPVAAPYRLAELRQGHPAPRQWREGSLRLTPQPARAAFAAALAVRDRRDGGR